MAWQNLNDVYIPKSGGGDIEGSLSVSGNLVVNDGSGNGTTYDVASEISDLKSAWDSVSLSFNNGCIFYKINNLIIGTFSSTITLDGYWAEHYFGNLPEGWRPPHTVSSPISMNELPTTARICITSDGKVSIVNCSGTDIPNNKNVSGVIVFIAQQHSVSHEVESLSITPPISYDESNFPLNKPSSMAWGRIINLAKDSDGDRYYLAVDHNNKLYVGVSVNGATTVTWATKQDSVSHDYVVGQYISTSNAAWSWRKWNSGIAECWVESAKSTLSSYDTWLGGYCYYITYVLPFGFVGGEPCVTFSGRIGSGLASPARHVVNGLNVTVYYLSSASGSNTVYSSIMVRGRWKQA